MLFHPSAAFTAGMTVLFTMQFYRCGQKYLRFETYDVRGVREEASSRFPFITVTPVPSFKNPKAGSFVDSDATVDDYCPEAAGLFNDSFLDLRACVEAATLQSSDVFDAAIYNDLPVPIEEVVRETPPLIVSLGTTFTFHLNKTIGGPQHRFVLKIKNMAAFVVPPTLTVNLHHEHTFNPYVYHDSENFDHRSELTFNGGSNTHLVASVLIRERHRIDTPERPCVKDEGYSVLQCTEDFVAQTLGCSSPWAKTGVPACNTKDQINRLIQLQGRLLQMSGSDFLDLTSCRQPCLVKEVEVIKETIFNYPYFPDGGNTLVLVLVSTSTKEVKESLLYDLNSLVGEVGGSLGLLLGFSLLTVFAESKRIFDVLHKI